MIPSSTSWPCSCYVKASSSAHLTSGNTVHDYGDSPSRALGGIEELTRSDAGRGAGRSAGRTSWNAKPEQDDYASFAAFLVYYTHYLDPFRPHEVDVTSSPRTRHDSPIFLFGGYSYGSMITAQLPPVERLLADFESPDAGSNAAQIRLRAENLASRENHILGSARIAMQEHRKKGSSGTLGMRMGGDEGGGSPRKSHESFGRKSMSADVEEKFRKGMDEIMAMARPGRHHKLPETMPVQPAQGKLPKVTDLAVPRAAYLLVSPLVGIVNHLASMSVFSTIRGRLKAPREDAAEAKLIRNPTLAVYGDEDVFVAVNKLRAWTKRLQDSQESRFRASEIATAGHFWTEEMVLYKMRDLVDEFATALLADTRERALHDTQETT